MSRWLKRCIVSGWKDESDAKREISCSTVEAPRLDLLAPASILLQPRRDSPASVAHRIDVKMGTPDMTPKGFYLTHTAPNIQWRC